MMPTQKFLVAYNSNDAGMQTNVRPWLLPNEAYAYMGNAYNYRGRTRKRPGSLYLGTDQYTSRLRILIDTTDGDGNRSGVYTPQKTAPMSGVITPAAVGQCFTIGTSTYTCKVLDGTLVTSGIGVATYDNTTGEFTITGGPPNTDIYFYPALPGMGLPTLEQSTLNVEQTVAFDQDYAYVYINGWERIYDNILDDPNASWWTGSNSDFLWACNYRGINSWENYLFVVNNNSADRIRYYTGNAWKFLTAQFGATSDLVVKTAAICVSFHNRLVLLNTVEYDGTGDRRYAQRARWCAFGDPTASEAWYDYVNGKGSWSDAPTTQHIVSASLIKDRLIVQFERSAYELVYTNNPQNPFEWYQLSNEFGAASRFSGVIIDNALITTGQTAITVNTGGAIQRIDQKIPNEIWDARYEQNGLERIYGIRDYLTENIYWAIPADYSNASAHTYPNRILCYNYPTASWAIFDDSITCFGYFQPIEGRTWGNTETLWENASFAWGDVTDQPKAIKILAANQQGYTFSIEQGVSRNVGAFQITEISINPSGSATLTVIDHNLDIDDYILIENCDGTDDIPDMNGTIFRVSAISDSDANTITVYNPDLKLESGDYYGKGTVAWVSEIELITKQYNFFLSEAKRNNIVKMDIQVDRTDTGIMAVLFSPDTADIVTVTKALVTYPIPERPLEYLSNRLWRAIYPNIAGEFVQVIITVSRENMFNPSIALSPFELHSIIYHVRPAGRLQ